MIRFENIKIRENLSKEEVFQYVCKKKRIKESQVINWNIFKKSIDARNKEDIFFNYTIDMECKNEKYIKNAKILNNFEDFKINVNRKSNKRPIIVGAGPAGLFCALTLVQNGIKPIVIEQGAKVEERKEDVENFRKNAILNTLSNIQFGEGGAGTFSDGKLTTNINSSLCKKVAEEFFNFGAPEEILYNSKPHIGTDKLINVIKNMREYIISKGGIFLFNTKVIDFEIDNQNIKGIYYQDFSNDKSNKETLSKFKINIKTKHDSSEISFIETDTVVLAIGHSARETFYKLYEKGFNLERKNFSVGVRIEHKQKMINESQYGNRTKLKLPPAEYKLAYHGDDRSCYTFCMCPGGYVMASSSEENTIVTNGMSEYSRDGENSNSAVLVNVLTTDFEGDSPLAGIEFQKELESKAFILGGSNYYAPIQRVEDFLNNKKTLCIGEVKPTYLPGVTLSNLNEILPEFVSKTLKEGLLKFDKDIKGFANPDAILTGVETRSSSPVRIIRNEDGISNINGVYPCGEGAGYAGGIMTAAVDGIKCAKFILEK